MRTIDEGVGITRIVELKAVNVQAGIPQASSQSIEEITRVAPKNLELIYRIDGTTFNAVNKFSQTIMAAGYVIKGDDENTKSYLIDFVDNIGNVGEETNWNELLTTIYRHLGIYGNAWVELVPNKGEDEIVDLNWIDPKRMDLARDSQQRVAVDKFGRPLGYVLEMPYGVEIIQTDKVPEGVSLMGNKKFLKPERIAHFKLYTFGEGFIGIGLIEPAYKSILRKLNLEEAYTNCMYNSAFAPRVGKAGDKDHEPTPQQIENFLNQLKDLNFKQNLAMPYYNDIQLLEPKKTERLADNVKYLQNQQIASSGMPEALVTGSGETTNRQILESQQKFYEYGLQDITRRICACIRKFIFKRVIELKFGKNQNIPNIIWNKVSEAETNDKAQRLATWIEKGVIRPDDEKLQDYVRDTENLE